MNLRDRTLFRMKQLGLNEYKLSKKMGYKNNSTISSLLRGRTDTFRNMARLATALETSSEWLLTGTDNKEIPIDVTKYASPIARLLLNLPVKGAADALNKALNDERLRLTAVMVADDMRNGRDIDPDRYEKIWEDAQKMKND